MATYLWYVHENACFLESTHRVQVLLQSWVSILGANFGRYAIRLVWLRRNSQDRWGKDEAGKIQLAFYERFGKLLGGRADPENHKDKYCQIGDLREWEGSLVFTHLKSRTEVVDLLSTAHLHSGLLRKSSSVARYHHGPHDHPIRTRHGKYLHSSSFLVAIPFWMNCQFAPGEEKACRSLSPGGDTGRDGGNIAWRMQESLTRNTCEACEEGGKKVPAGFAMQ